MPPGAEVRSPGAAAATIAPMVAPAPTPRADFIKLRRLFIWLPIVSLPGAEFHLPPGRDPREIRLRRKSPPASTFQRNPDSHGGDSATAHCRGENVGRLAEQFSRGNFR